MMMNHTHGWCVESVWKDSNLFDCLPVSLDVLLQRAGRLVLFERQLAHQSAVISLKLQ